ncbi:MAG: AAA family ATPase [Gemmataceae bacterium]|nr:AAA family ATPase [Gemmataceae bacterium]
MIKHIRIRNFRSLHDVAVDLDPLTVLIGRSGTGKSNFVRAIRLLRNVLASPDYLHHTFGRNFHDFLSLPNRGGMLDYHVTLSVRGFSEELRYTVGFAQDESGPANQPKYERLDAGGQVVFHQEGLRWIVPPNVRPAPPPGQLALASVSGLRPATVAYIALTSGLGCYDFPGTVLQPENTGDPFGRPATSPPPYAGRVAGSGFADDGGNYLATAEGIVNNLDRLGDWAEVAGALGTLNRSVKGVDLRQPRRDGLDVAHAIGDKLLLLDAAEESEGFRRFFAHLLALYQTPPKQTVIFEHPESGIHPGALATLFEEFEDYVRDRLDRKARGQVILTTHSPRLLDKFAVDDIRVVDIEDGTTRIGRLAPEQAEALHDHLYRAGDLLTVDPARLPGQLAEVPG